MNVGRIHNLAWVLATVIASVGMILRAGVLGLPLGSAFGPQILLRALAAAVIGRMENLAVIFAAACAIGVVEVAIIWNEGSALLIDPVLFVIVLGALLLQRRNRESPVDDETLSTWSLAASVRPVPRELARLPEVRWVFRGLRVLFVLALFALPALLDERYTNLAAAVVIYAIVAVSLVLLTGWAGEISLGQVAFVAIGSAAAGAANVHWHLAPVASFLLAGLVGALASVVIGVPALRIRGLFLSVTTLAFAVATSSFLLNHDYFPFLPDQIADRVLRRPVWTPLGHLAINTERRYYYVAAVGLVLVLLAVRGLQRSRVERDVVATRDNERSSAQAFRLSPARAKLLAFALSGFFASFAGGLLVLHQQALGQQIFAPIESLRALTMVVVGGLGSVSGAIIGAVFVKSTEWFNVIVPQRFRFLFTFSGSGIGLLLVLWLLPGGFGSVLYSIRDTWLRFVARRRGIVSPAFVTDAGVSRPPLVRIPRIRLRTPRPTILEDTPAVAPSGLLAAHTAPVALEFRDVDVAYGHVQVLFGASLEVHRGETVALLGTNGAGKSTMLRTASGLLRPYHGRIRFEGSDIGGLAPHKVAALGVLHVPGGRSVFPSLSVRDNLKVAAWLCRRDREAVHAGTERVLDIFPSLRDRLDDPAAALSGGQQQMLTIAMSLVVEPKVLMIDELSLGLSPLLVEQLLDVVRALHDKGVTVVVVEQAVSTALATADRAYFLEKGVIRFHGRTAELLSRPDLVRSIFLEGAEPVASPAPLHEPAKGETGEVILATEHLSKRFAGVMALDDVTLELRQGEILGLIGPNGAGKTTLFDLVSGFLVPDEGRVVLARPGPRRHATGRSRATRPRPLLPELADLPVTHRPPDTVRRARRRAPALGSRHRRPAPAARRARGTASRRARRRAARDDGAPRLPRQVRGRPVDREPAHRGPRLSDRRAAVGDPARRAVGGHRAARDRSARTGAPAGPRSHGREPAPDRARPPAGHGGLRPHRRPRRRARRQRGRRGARRQRPAGGGVVPRDERARLTPRVARPQVAHASRATLG